MRLRMHTKQIILLLSNNGSNNTKGWQQQQQQEQQEQQQLFQVHRKAVIPGAVAICRNRNRNRCTGPRQIEARSERDGRMEQDAGLPNCHNMADYPTPVANAIAIAIPVAVAVAVARCKCHKPLQVAKPLSATQQKFSLKWQLAKLYRVAPAFHATLPISTLLPATAGAGSAPASDLTVGA